MGSRRSAREAVLEALYCYEIRDHEQDLAEVFDYCAEGHNLDKKGKEFGFNLLKKVVEKSEDLDEAIELAKTYGSADSSRFVNGILDALGKEHQADYN
jgi:transcription termination factor NusB